MSVIGPRPGLWNQDILTAERDKYNANDVKPGLVKIINVLKIKIFCIYLDILSEPWVTMEEDHQENEGLCHPCAVEFQ